MLRALGESRNRQSRLVADARRHELRTPLTSLRTNMELLNASSRPGAPSIPDEEHGRSARGRRRAIEELSTLVGDLVGPGPRGRPRDGVRTRDLSEVVERSLEKARRRRNEIDFEARTTPWLIYGDQAGLSRAVLNVLDNAAKWSPTGTGSSHDAADRGPAARTRRRRCGPGIPLEDRELVFERFYRSTASRSMPGSGLAWPSSGRSVVANTAARSRWRRRAEAAPGSASCCRASRGRGALIRSVGSFGRSAVELCCWPARVRTRETERDVSAASQTGRAVW